MYTVSFACDKEKECCCGIVRGKFCAGHSTVIANNENYTLLDGKGCSKNPDMLYFCQDKNVAAIAQEICGGEYGCQKASVDPNKLGTDYCEE